MEHPPQHPSCPGSPGRATTSRARGVPSVKDRRCSGGLRSLFGHIQPFAEADFGAVGGMDARNIKHILINVRDSA